MALLVWLPLNGNLKNQGLSQVTVTNNGATINDSGKIGKCYSFDGSYSYISLSSTALFNCFKGESNPFSIAFWVYNNESSGARAILFGDYNTTEAINFNIEINGNASNNSIRFYWNDSPDWGATNSIVALNTWSHVVITYDGSYIKIYINGILKDTRAYSLSIKTKTSGEFRIGRDGRTGETALNGKINDFRIYDHCLSPKEVKEISKGLVIHYKFDDDYIEGTTNLCSNTRGGWDNSGTCNRDYDNSTIPNRPIPEYVYATTATSDGNMAVTFGYTSSNLPSKTIIASTYCWLEDPLDSSTVYVRSSKTDGSVGLLYYNGDSNPNNWPKGQWIRISSNAIATASDATTFYICTYINKNNEVRAFNGWLIEEKNHITPWIAPGKSRAKSTTIYDCSGYEYNGSIVGDIIMNDNSPRYLKYTNFPDSACSIGIGNLSTLVPEGIFTFNIWLRKNTNEWSSKSYETILGGPGGFELEAKRGGTNSPEIVLYNWGSGGTAYNLDVWNMVTFVRTTSDTKLYLNGVLKVTGSAGSIPSGNYFIGSLSSATQLNFRGYLSDARLYVTALSEDDIKELYNTSSYIYNDGTIASYTFNSACINLTEEANYGIAIKSWRGGLSSFTESNCSCTLTDTGYRIYRGPNLTVDNNGYTMWGGFVLDNTNNRFGFIKGNTYVIQFEVKGKSSNTASDIYWTNLVGWRGGGLDASPSNVVCVNPVSANFQSDEWKTVIYKWTINDDVYKVCTSSYSSFVQGNTYISYKGFKFGFGYTSTGTLGTDLYIRNVRMYNITANKDILIEKEGIVKANFAEGSSDAEFINSNTILSNQLIEI